MSDDHTVPDLRAQYSTDPWSAFVDHTDGPTAEPDYQIPRRVLKIPGLSLPHRIVLGLLWDSGDRGAIGTGEPIQTWLSSDTLAERLGLSRRSIVRAIKAAGDLGFVIRLADLVPGHDVRVVRGCPGQWTRDRPTCACAPGARDPYHCCCRVLAPIDEEGRVTLVFDQATRLMRSERVAEKVRQAIPHATERQERDAGVPIPTQDHRDAGVPINPIHGDVGVPQPTPSRPSPTLDRRATTADPDEMPWYIVHGIEHAPWVDE